MSSLTRPLAGPILTFDLPTIASGLRREEAYHRTGRAGRTLAKSGRFRMLIVAMADGNVITTHHAESPLTIQVLEGKIRFRTGDGHHELRQHELLFFGPGDAHDIQAERETILLLTLSALGDDYDPPL